MLPSLFFTVFLIAVLRVTESHQDSRVQVAVRQRKINTRSGIAILEQFLIGSRTSALSAEGEDRSLPKSGDEPSGLSAGVEDWSLPKSWDEPVGRRQELLEKAALLMAVNDKPAGNQAGRHTVENGNDQIHQSERQNDLLVIGRVKEDYSTWSKQPVGEQPAGEQSIGEQPTIGVARTKVYRVEGDGVPHDSLDGKFKTARGFGNSAQKLPTERNPATMEGKSETLGIVGEGVPINVLSDDGQVIQLIVSNSTKAEVERRNPERMSAVYRVEGVRSGQQTHSLRVFFNSMTKSEDAAYHPTRKTPNQKTALRYRAMLNPFWMRWTKAVEALRKERLARVTATMTRSKNTDEEPPLMVTLQAKREYKK